VDRTCPLDTDWWVGNSVGQRIEMGPLLKRLISAYGPKRTSLVAPHMSAFGLKADMRRGHSPFSSGGRRRKTIAVELDRLTDD
jgi:hypothetical protein